ncbi:MAG TPA: hydrogenase maturation nickel metallochaperone HypA [Gammaproteobacteria bacterium]
MHELSLAEGVLQIVEESAQRQGFTRVKEIRLEIGALSGVEIEALRFCIEAVLRNSLAEGARVIIEPIPARGRCMQCGEMVEIAARYDACPQCGCQLVQPAGGTEMRVKDLLVE